MTPSSQCDNIESSCLDVIALAELLAPHDVISTSVMSSKDHSGPGRPFMISFHRQFSGRAPTTCAVQGSKAIKKPFLGDSISTGDIATMNIKGTFLFRHSSQSGPVLCAGNDKLIPLLPYGNSLPTHAEIHGGKV